MQAHSRKIFKIVLVAEKSRSWRIGNNLPQLPGASWAFILADRGQAFRPWSPNRKAMVEW
jgi:hypothetical protein